MTYLWLRKLYAADTAVSSVEYAVLLGILGAGILAAVLGLGGQIGQRLEDSANTIDI